MKKIGRGSSSNVSSTKKISSEILDPLSSALEGSDPLSLMAAEVQMMDPLSQMASQMSMSEKVRVAHVAL